ncbi:MAG: catechol 2,3-dioxygenase [Candidatus Binataceae bacterium]
MKVMRLGHVSLRVTDLERARDHYANTLGLIETHRDTDGGTYYKAWDEWDKYCLVLNAGTRPGANHVAFKVESDADLDGFARRAEKWGVAVEMLKPGTVNFVGRTVKITLPGGPIVMLYAEKEFVGKSVGSLNPDPWPDGLKGCGVMHLDHCLFVNQLDPANGVNRVEECSRFFQEALDFKLTEQIVGGPDNRIQASAFLACTSKPHDIAFVPGPQAGFHHLAFYVDSWDAVLKAGDVLSKRKVKIDIGPTRHGITRGSTIYFFDPSGNRNETFSGLGYVVSRDMPTITWTEENLGQAIFYHHRELNPAFTSVYTDAA